MKLSKVTRVLDEFDIDPADYRIDKLDINRCPQTKYFRNGEVEQRVQVSMLFEGQKTEMIPESKDVKTTLQQNSDDMLAVYVEFHRLVNNETEKFEKMLLIN